MDKFLPSIKQKYKDRLINREKQWPPCHSNKLVRLELVEREKGKGYCDNIPRGSLERSEKDARFYYKDQYSNNKKETVTRTSLAYNSLFIEKGGKKPVRKILVEGDAGIGKTTLSVSISEDWSCDKLFQEFELVLLLPLRHKKVASAGSLPELLKLLHPSADVCKSVASYLEEEEAKKVLVIADGWDELSETERQEGSFLYDLLFETFPLMSVVVTSRPSASAPLHRLPCFDRFVEINGFGKDDIREYIHCEFSSEHEKACRLLEQLEDNPLIESVCSVPLNCAIICHLWRTSEEVLPSTMTQLYTKIILNVILRNMQKKYSFKNVLSLPNFDALPKELQLSFKLLCKFAFESLKSNQIVFSQEELAEFFPEGFALDEEILCFGLLQSTETVLENGLGVSFHFLHLTFMEYLAALHLSKQPHNTLLEVFSQKLDDAFCTSHFDIVWRFFFGISFSGSNSDQKDISMKALEYVAKPSLSSRLSLCHCAFESQNDSITHTAIRFIDMEDSLFKWGFGLLQNAYDFSALLHVIENMEEYSSMTIDVSHCGVRKKQIRRLTDILASKQGKLRVKELNVSGNKLIGECMSDLFTRASTAFEPNVTDFCTLTPVRNGLSRLILSEVPLEVSDVKELKRVACCTEVFTNLYYLNLKGCLTAVANTNATSFTTFIETLSTNCPRVWELDLSSNNLGVPGVSAVVKSVVRFTRCLHPRSYFGFHLYLNDNDIGDEGLKAFRDNLCSTNNISNLKLVGNSIHAAGVSYLTKFVCSRKRLKSYFYSDSKLDLSDNPLGLEGTLAVGKMLSNSHYYRFENIKLCRCKLTTVENSFVNTGSTCLSNSGSSESALIHAGQQLFLMPLNWTITGLYLSGNNFAGEGIHILIGIMHQCVRLIKLYCSDCGITSDDLILLLDTLHHIKDSSPNVCIPLSVWDLSNNTIDDRGALALIDFDISSLIQYCIDHDFCDGSGLVLAGNLVSIEISKEIADEVETIEEEVSYTD